MNRALNALLFTSGIIFGSIFSSLIVSAWTGPSQAAPNGNVSAPLNVGPTSQIKNGILGVNGLAVYGDTILSGSNLYLNFGNSAGVNGYGIRDNAGTLEFKNTGGAWNNFTNSVLNVLGVGAVTSLKFSDGTTQSTAATGALGGTLFASAYVTTPTAVLNSSHNIASVVRNSSGVYTFTLTTPASNANYIVVATMNNGNHGGIYINTRTTTTFQILEADPNLGTIEQSFSVVVII